MWGVLFAIIALLFWGVGDFLLQKSARKLGNLLTLFYIGVFGALMFLPFAWRSIYSLLNSPKELLVLIITSILVLLAGLLYTQALKIGKISVIDPVFAIEIPITILITTLIIREKMNFIQGFFVIFVVVGLFLLSTKSFGEFKKARFEKGIWMAILGTFLMGLVNFLFGVGSRLTDPILVNWFTSFFIFVVVLFYLIFKSQTKLISKSWQDNKKLIFSLGFLDNFAWLAYSFGMVFLSIPMATGISQGYIGIAAVLGFVFNKEKLKKHQWWGLAISLIAVIALCFISE